MTNRDPLYRRHRFPTEIIAHAVWLFFRFAFAPADGQGHLAGPGIIVSQTIRLWAEKFGRTSPTTSFDPTML
ncbi:transposase-like protein [Rhizobium giardinii]|uniref:Transposase-like protein n=1 Tax=Rhizobium giardinii TaxID=56731 RepID=A0A7W8UB79_9HYPH|nr:transposase-like protein [Rhizobium giardinii]